MPNHPLLLGHRGARGVKSIPENTLASFDFALSSSCDGFEFDVRLSSDGQAVIAHDEKVRGFEIARTSCAELGLPVLSEVMSRYRQSAFLDIELKVAGLESITADLLRKFRPERGVVVSSFLPSVIESLHALDREIPLGLICESEEQLKRWPELAVDFVMVQRKLAGKKVTEKLTAAGKKILVWTVNLRADMERFAKMNVDGIISDEPKRLAKVLRGEKREDGWR